MSSFYLRNGEAQNGDQADHSIYGHVHLVGKIEVSDNYGDTFWLVETEENELKIANQNDLENIGYYGD